ncbi:thiol:disulfide interchange protein [Moraxella caviae]|uniref:Thiol:disulfide interchange protein n=2 Tax=Moraxella caviae TaxID=34060 RepID=A0A1T0A5R8_9GAMM|nr:thiol:disulfide interchange protein [Moraxella caviae]
MENNMANPARRALIFIVPLVIFALLIVMFFFRLGDETDVKINTSMNKPLPEFSLPLLSDTSRTMTNADLPKTPFLLNVWGSWCPTCRVEHPFLMELHAKGVPMVGVNYKDELPDALAYLNEFQDPFVYSIQDLSGEYALDLGLTGAPETFVVDGKGVVYKHILGEVNAQNYADDIELCLTALGDDALSEEDKTLACS